MEMSFFFSGTVCDFLFSGVNVVTTWGMVSLCMGLVSLSLLSEGFKVGRSLLQKVATSSRDSGCTRYSSSERVRFHILQTFFHIIQLTIGYMLMLAVMTYNAYFLVAVVGGAGLGYYCFALFDLPSKLLGTHMSRPAHWSASTSPPHLSEGNSSVYCGSYGAAGSVVSPVGPCVSSLPEPGSHSMYGAALGEDGMEEGGRVVVSDTCEGEKHASSSGISGEDEPDGLRGASALVDISDQACLLPQDTIKVEVQVHAFPDE